VSGMSIVATTRNVKEIIRKKLAKGKRKKDDMNEVDLTLKGSYINALKTIILAYMDIYDKDSPEVTKEISEGIEFFRWLIPVLERASEA
jgi:ferric iron reductase protein FhuF